MIPILFRLGPVTVYSYGLMVALAFLVGRRVFLCGLERRGIPMQQGDSYPLGALVGGIVGAHLYYIVEHWQEVGTNPLPAIFSGSGLVWYGGLLGGAATVLVLVRVKKHPLAKVVDAFGPALAMSYILGRIGCFLSGDGCYGKPSDLPWAMSFPNGMVPTTARVHLTPLYEVVMTLGIFYVLKRMEWKSTPAGSVFWAYLGLASLERFLTGFTRTNPDVFLGLSTIQLISLVGMVLTFLMLLRLLHVERALNNA